MGDVETRRAVLADVDLGPLKTVGPGEAAAGRSELVLAMAEPDSFRPDERSLADQSAVVVADLLYDGLTEVDGHTGALVPALARSWTSDASFRNWTFQLDPGAGVTAADVVAALTPLACDPNAPAGATQSAPALTAGISSVTAIEEDVVAIDLVHPNAGLAWILSGLPYSVIGIDGSQTGDYEVSRTDDGGLWLERRSVRPGQPGTPQSVQIRWTSSSATAHRLLADGVVDGAIIGPDRLDDIDGRFTVATSPSTAVRFYVLNPTAD
ncbi:MAG: ABC transporter substrate-binding protein, partial [Actinomycetota bacterium]